MGKKKIAPIDDLTEVRLSGSHNTEISWITDMPFKVPKEFLEKYCYNLNGSIRLNWTKGECSLAPEAIAESEKIEVVSYLRTLRMFTDNAPLSSKLPFSYQLIPPSLRSIIARAIGQKKRKNVHKWASFPSFPLDLSSDALSDILGIRYKKLKPMPVMLTHDIDSPEGLRNLPMFLADEEAVGARSTNFVVPCKWRIDHGILSELKQRGHEIGIHGFNHSNKTPFMDEPAINQRIDKMRGFIERYGVSGYRAPSLLRTRRLLRCLSNVFKYDSSIPTSGGLFPVPNNGCASARLFEVEGICEIPLSMLRDGTLLFLGYRPDEIKDIWIKCAETIGKSGGVVVLLTHCEKRFTGNSKMFSIYREIIQHLSSDERFIFKACREVFRMYSEGNPH